VNLGGLFPECAAEIEFCKNKIDFWVTGRCPRSLMDEIVLVNKRYWSGSALLLSAGKVEAEENLAG